jgi:hypothetical protein
MPRETTIEMEPAKPAKLAKLGKPRKPTKPKKPVEPVEPARATEPALLVKTTEPVEPMEPIEPTRRPTAGQKRDGREGELGGLRDLCGKLRKLEPSELKTLCEYVPLNELAAGTVLEVHGCERGQSAHGEMALLDCTTDGTFFKQRIMAPARFVDKGLYPCAMVYFGKGQQKTQKGGMQLVHMLRRYGGIGDAFANHEEMRQKVTEMRNMPYGSLEQLFVIRCLKEFPENTVLLYTSHRTVQICTRDPVRNATALVASFETVIGDRAVAGEVYIPTRYADGLEDNQQGVALYKGIATSVSTGHDYYKLEFLSGEEAERAVAAH